MAAVDNPVHPDDDPVPVSIAELAAGAVSAELSLDIDNAPASPLMFLDLDRGTSQDEVDAALAWIESASTMITIGVTHGPCSTGVDRLAAATTLTITDTTPQGSTVRVDDVDVAVRAIAATVARAPRAAVALDGLLRLTSRSGVMVGLVAESLAYSMLLSGPEFAAWRRQRPTPRDRSDVTGPAVVLKREDKVLTVELDRPQRHNAFGREIRDGLIEALDLASSDDAIDRIVIRGRGRSFCSGGDLDEFGTARDVASAHLVRIDRSVGARIDRLRDRTTVEVHGACIGAGVELPSFASRVVARDDAYFRLPELSMGLVPGAGGTVSITRRIGRAHTAYLALSGTTIDAVTALRWGLVDEVL